MYKDVKINKIYSKILSKKILFWCSRGATRPSGFVQMCDSDLPAHHWGDHCDGNWSCNWGLCVCHKILVTWALLFFNPSSTFYNVNEVCYVCVLVQCSANIGSHRKKREKKLIFLGLNPMTCEITRLWVCVPVSFISLFSQNYIVIVKMKEDEINSHLL